MNREYDDRLNWTTGRLVTNSLKQWQNSRKNNNRLNIFFSYFSGDAREKKAVNVLPDNLYCPHGDTKIKTTANTSVVHALR